MPTPAYAPVRNSEDDASPAAPGGGGGPPPNNPLLSYWREFQERTPYVTRTSLIAMAICYLVSFFFNAEVTLGNVPFFTVFSFEIYRVITAPFVGNSFLTLVMVVLFYPAMGTKMEASVGSAAFLYLMAAMTVVINIVFLAVCFLLYAVGMVEALFYSCSSFWLVLFALIVIECMQAPEQPRRIFMLPMDIPSKYFPLLMYAVFSLLSGPALSFAVSMGVGYLYSWGHLDRFLKPAQGQLEAYEAEGGVLHAASRNPGWILASAAVGIEAWAAQQGSAPAGGGGGLPSWTGGGASGGAGAGGGGEAGADARPSPVRTCILHYVEDPTAPFLFFLTRFLSFSLSVKFSGTGHRLNAGGSVAPLGASTAGGWLSGAFSSAASAAASSSSSSSSGSALTDREAINARRLAALGGGGGSEGQRAEQGEGGGKTDLQRLQVSGAGLVGLAGRGRRGGYGATDAAAAAAAAVGPPRPGTSAADRELIAARRLAALGAKGDGPSGGK